MSDKPWKAFERECAALINGHRKPANSGHKIDVESENVRTEDAVFGVVGQCKEVQDLSLAQLTRLVVEVDAEAGRVNKRGLVFVKLRSGRGHPTPTLVVQSAASWKEEHP